ncbi:MAG: LysE family translocator [Desulfobacter sp.]|nr:MAG: LysE family translocator [Desulfobacter sp.]
MLNTEFLITSLVVVLIPGTGVIYTISNGLFLGTRASIAAAVGCTAGIIPHLAASIFGLSAILHMGALAFQAVKFAGAAYLLYLAWGMWRETGGLAFDSPGDGAGLWKIVKRGVLINILNPKLSVFFLAFLPLFVSADGPSPILQMMGLSAVFMIMTLVVFILYGLAAGRFGRYVVNSPGVISRLQRTFAAVFALLGIKLAITD